MRRSLKYLVGAATLALTTYTFIGIRAQHTKVRSPNSGVVFNSADKSLEEELRAYDNMSQWYQGRTLLVRQGKVKGGYELSPKQGGWQGFVGPMSGGDWPLEDLESFAKMYTEKASELRKHIKN